MAFKTVSLEHWHALQLARVEESRAFSGQTQHPAPATVEQVEFSMLAGRVFWNRFHADGARDFFPTNRRMELPTGDELRGSDSKRAWGRLYFMAAEILFACVELDMQLTPAEFGLSTPRLEVAENAKAVSELLTPRFSKYFLALQSLDGKFTASDVIDWIGKQNLEAAQTTNDNALELMAA